MPRNGVQRLMIANDMNDRVFVVVPERTSEEGCADKIAFGELVVLMDDNTTIIERGEGWKWGEY